MEPKFEGKSESFISGNYETELRVSEGKDTIP